MIWDDLNLAKEQTSQESIHEGILVAEAFDKFLGCLVGHHGSPQSQVDWVSHKDPTKVPFWNPTKKGWVKSVKSVHRISGEQF